MELKVMQVLCCLLFGLMGNIIGEKTESLLSQKIYEKIPGILPCFRRMNATHQIGCSSAANGDVGVVHLIHSDPGNETLDLDWVLKTGPHPPYVVLLDLHSFRRDLLRKLNNPDRVSGILLLQNNETRKDITQFSTESSCPNERYGFYRNESHQCETWNEPGSSLLFDDWAFSIIYVRGKNQTKALLDCYNKFNKPNADLSPRDWPLCAAELKSHMYAAVDSPTCVRRNALSMSPWNISPRSICDPVGGVNILTPLAPRSQAEPYEATDQGSVIVIATRLDTSSLFDKLAPGADSSATGLTALLALVKQLQPLRQYLPNTDIQNVYFVIFNGEAFDYIGSSRVVYDMLKDKFPSENKNSSSYPALLRLKDIKYFIEVEQLAHYYDPNNTNSMTYFVHRNWDSTNVNTTEAVKHLFDTLDAQSKGFEGLYISSVTKQKDWKGLPSASLQSFLLKNPDFPGIVITNHHKTYLNKYYNSILDDYENIGYNGSTLSPTVRSISSLVAAIGRTVEKLILPNSTEESWINDDPDLVNDILQCYVKSALCPLFTGLRKDNLNIPDEPFPLYAGVNSRYRLTLASDITAKLMTYFQGNINITYKKEDECKHDSEKPIFDFIWLNGSCFNTTVSLTDARSPAFDIDDYDWKSGEFSTWTESSWTTYSVRIFLKPSMTHELLTFFFGLAIFLLSSVIVYWINGKSEFIFQTRGDQIC